MKKRWGRPCLAAFLALYVGVAAAGRDTAGFDLLDEVGVARVLPTFLDMRAITSAWECDRLGVDVLAANPCDPLQRPMNYPRVWTWPSGLGFEQDSAEVLGPLAGAAFLASALVVAGPLTLGEAAVHAGVIASPSVMLGVERGNTDLLMFALVVLALVAMRHRRVRVRHLAAPIVVLAGVLKVFPFLAGAALLRRPRGPALASVAGVGLAAGAYALATRHDLDLIGQGTPQTVPLAYGADVLWDGLRSGEALARPVGWLDGDGAERLATAGAVALVLLACVLLVRWVGRDARVGAAAGEGLALDALWAGAAVYVGTFALGHHIDYRLVFLVLVVPQTLAWARAGGRVGLLARAAIVVLLGTLWLSAELVRAFPIDEILNWCLLAYLVTALALTVPAWGAGADPERAGSGA